MYVYLIKNKINGKKYVGKTIRTLEDRFREHKVKSKGSKTYLHKSMQKYGVDNFIIKEIEKVSGDIEDLNEREKYWIALLQPEYNMTAGGDGGDTSKSPNLQYYYNEIRPNQISGKSNPFYGKKHSEETIQKNREWHLGKKLTEETKSKISERMKGRKLSEESIKKRTAKIAQYWKIITPEGKEIIIQNLKEFCRDNGLDQRNMSKVAAGIYKTSKGYKCEKMKGEK